MRIDIVTRRTGALARFGHDHVVIASSLTGYAADSDPLRADLKLIWADLQVDDPEARARHRLDTEPSLEDIERTRENMLYRVLSADAWPAIEMRVTAVSGGTNEDTAHLELRHTGSVHETTIPVTVRRGDREVIVESRFDLRQTDIGLEPFSAFNGGLRVADTLEIRASIRFRRWP